MRRKDVPCCCEGMRILRGDYFEMGGDLPPISFSEKSGYGFAGRGAYYCPLCGQKLSEYLPRSQEVEKAFNSDFCCETLEFRVNLPDHHDRFEIFYQPWIRRYFFSDTEDPRDDRDKGKVYPEWDFNYCLFCGKKLPECLSKEWLEIVQTEFGIPKETPMKEILEKIPKKFRTEEWWSGHSHRPKIIEQDPSDNFTIISTHGRWWDKKGCEDCLKNQ